MLKNRVKKLLLLLIQGASIYSQTAFPPGCCKRTRVVQLVLVTVLNWSLMSQYWRCSTPILYQSFEWSYVYIHFWFMFVYISVIHYSHQFIGLQGGKAYFKTCLNNTTAGLLKPCRTASNKREGIASSSMTKYILPPWILLLLAWCGIVLQLFLEVVWVAVATCC